MDTQPTSRRKRQASTKPRRAWVFGLPLSLCLCGPGCTWDLWNLNKPEAPPGPVDSLVLRGDGLEADKPPADAKDAKVAADLAGAHELYRRGEYSKARALFRAVADNQHNSPAVAEEARYYQAECLRQEGYYPDAADYYVKMLNDFPSGAYREQAIQHMYDIADYWLEDTREGIREAKEKKEGKRWWVGQHFFNWDKHKPLLDEEGYAIEKLEQVRYNDMTGPLADKALFLMGTVKFFNEDYREADHYFSQLVEMHPNSPFAPQAVELAIIAKNLGTGGADYDARKVAEARRLVDTAFRTYPELAHKKEDFLVRQLGGITMQQAEKDYKIAEFYQRTGHPESAYFCYEIVRRRYPGTKFFDLATERMHNMHDQAEKAGAKTLPPPPGAPAAPPAGTLPLPAQPITPGQPLTAPDAGAPAEMAPALRNLPDPLR